MPVTYPLTTGNRLDASSIELNLNGKRYIGFSEMEYEQSLTPGEVRGATPQVLGYTRGIYKAGGTLSIFREEFQDLTNDLQSLAVGFMEANFLATVTYSELPPFASIPIPLFSSIDTLVGLRFTDTKHIIKAGSADGLIVTLPFVCRLILVNGIQPMNNILKFAVAAIAA